MRQEAVLLPQLPIPTPPAQGSSVDSAMCARVPRVLAAPPLSLLQPFLLPFYPSDYLFPTRRQLG